jgi:Ran GTPase-activating protein (RanGAP) involved in mRNA processing and transport
MGISSRAIDILALSLRNHFYVHRLSLRGSLRSSRHLAVLSKSLELNASLTFLDLSNNEVVFANQAMPEEFVDAMRTNGNIQELVLDRNGLATLEIKTLVPGVLHNITTLSLRSNRIDDEGARVLVNWILLRTKSLRNLDLASNEITDVGASKISEALSSSSSTLYTLDLSKNEIKDDGAVSIANALKQSSSVLRTLHLEHNPFTSQASREIAKMARVNLSLTHLSFAHYVLDNSALQALRVAFDFF